MERRPSDASRSGRSLRSDGKVRRARDYRSHPLQEGSARAHRPHRDARKAEVLDYTRKLRRLHGRHREGEHAGQTAVRHARRAGCRGHTEPSPRQTQCAHRGAGPQEIHQRRPDGARDSRRDPAAGRGQHRVSSPSPDDHQTGNRDVPPVGPSQGARRPGRRLGGREPRRSVFRDQPQTLSVCRQQRFPQAKAPLLVEDACEVRQDVARCQSRPQGKRRHRDHAIPEEPC